MIGKPIPYRILLIVAIGLLSVWFEVPPFHADYYSDPPFIHYFLITSTSFLIFLFPNDTFIFAEKVTYAALVSLPALLISGFLVNGVMGWMYGYDSNSGELKSAALLDSSLFYLAVNLMGIGFFKIWLRYRKPIHS